MNILVTGANGFIGRKLAAALAGRGDRACGIYSRRVPAGDAEGFVCDLSSDAAVGELLPKLAAVRWDAVVHLASVLCNESSDDDEVFQSNLAITRNLTRICRELRPPQLVHASSIAVYPNETGIYSETAPVRPSANAEGLYGLSKVCAENYFDHQLRGESIEVIHLRLAQVWGEGMRSDRIMSIMREELEESGKISVFGNGERVSNFVRIDRVVGVLLRLIGRSDVAGIYNLGGESLSYLELAERVVAEQGGSPGAIVKVEKGSRARFMLDSSKLDQLLAGLPD